VISNDRSPAAGSQRSALLRMRRSRVVRAKRPSPRATCLHNRLPLSLSQRSVLRQMPWATAARSAASGNAGGSGVSSEASSTVAGRFSPVAKRRACTRRGTFASSASRSNQSPFRRWLAGRPATIAPRNSVWARSTRPSTNMPRSRSASSARSIAARDGPVS